MDFLHDGVFATDVKTILDCMEDSHDFHFERRWGIPVPGRNFVHRSGTLFVRVLTDRNGLCVLIVLGNYRYLLTSKDPNIVALYHKAFRALTDCVASLGNDVESPQPPLPPPPASACPSAATLQGRLSVVMPPSPGSKTTTTITTGTRKQTDAVDASTSDTSLSAAHPTAAIHEESPPMAQELNTIPNINSNTEDNPSSSLVISVDKSAAGVVVVVSDKIDSVATPTVVGDDEADQLAATDTSESREELMGVPIVDSEDSKQQQAHTTGPD
jgi:hypothetical protein